MNYDTDESNERLNKVFDLKKYQNISFQTK